MIRLFISFYLILAACFVGFQLVGNALEKGYFKDLVNYDKANDYIGAFYFLNELHKNLDEPSFKKVVENFPKTSNIPIEIAELSNFSLPDEELSLLKKGDIYVEDSDMDILFYQLEGADLVVRIGPMQTYERLEEVSNWFNQVFFLVLGVSAFVWILSLQFKLKRLDNAASQFGEGDLNVRVSEKGRHKVGRLNHSFNVMADRIEKLIKGHKSLTNAVAHEIRTPVSRIRFQLDMMYEERGESQRKEYMYGMSDDLNELSDLVDELLTYARFDRQALVINMAGHSLHQSILNVINARHFQSDLRLLYDESWCAGEQSEHNLPFEPKYLERAIGNLVSNAKKYACSKIQIHVHNQFGRCAIYVDDDGPGIPENQRQDIFQPFNRLDNSRTRATGGYGLGLAIVKQIALLHGGEVSVETAPLGGARFVFSWPTNHHAS